MSIFKLKRQIHEQFLIKLNSPYESLDIFSEFLLSLNPTNSYDKFILNKLSKINKIYFYIDCYDNTTYNEINNIFEVFYIDNRVDVNDTFVSNDDMISYILKICSFHKLKSKNILIELFNYLNNISIHRHLKIYKFFNEDNEYNEDTSNIINDIDNINIDDIIDDDITIIDDLTQSSNNDSINDKSDNSNDMLNINNKIDDIHTVFYEELYVYKNKVRIMYDDIQKHKTDLFFTKLILAIYYFMFLYMLFKK